MPEITIKKKSSQDDINTKAQMGAAKISFKRKQMSDFMAENEASRPVEAKTLRMTKKGDLENDDKPDPNENPAKRQARIEAREAGSKIYDFNGKKEYAGPVANANKLEDRTISRPKLSVETSMASIKSIPSKEPSKITIKRKEPSGSKSYKLQDQAPGLGGKNKLQKKY